MFVPARSHGHNVQRHALLVLGMHRSGTSALTGLLVHLGAQAPTTLMPANVNNPLGFWESQRFCEFHDRLLRSAGTSWDAWTHVDPDALSDEVSSRLASECRLLLEQEFGSAAFLAIKDPRVCRLVPFWLQILDAEAILPAPVLICRNPFEVAGSLERASGVARDHSLLMWLRHVLDSEIATRGIRRSIVRYHDLLADPRTAIARMSESLGLQWPTSSLTDEEIGRLLKPALCCHETGIQPPVSTLNDWLMQTFEALDNLASERQSADSAHETLDRVRSEFDRTTAVFGSLFDREGAQRRAFVENTKQREAESQQHTESLKGEHAQLLADRDQLLDQAATLQTERDRLRRHAERIEAELEARKQSAVELEEANRNLTAELASASEHIETLRKSASWRLTAPLRVTWGLLRSFYRPRARSTERENS
jgi:hypothetical protein